MSIGWISLDIPPTVEDGKVSLKEAYSIRRIYRRLAKMRERGSLRRLTVYVRYDNVIELLDYRGTLGRSS